MESEDVTTPIRVRPTGPTDAFEGSSLAAARPQVPTSPASKEETGSVDDFKTLKQACSSEYQGAQGAFKDSMIH
jgi:hypothetical protein